MCEIIISEPAPAPKVDPNEFEWSEDIIAVHDQAAIAVYSNPSDDIVIRWRGSWPDDDVYGIVTRQNLAQLISRLQQFERGED